MATCQELRETFDDLKDSILSEYDDYNDLSRQVIGERDVATLREIAEELNNISVKIDIDINQLKKIANEANQSQCRGGLYENIIDFIFKADTYSTNADNAAQKAFSEAAKISDAAQKAKNQPAPVAAATTAASNTAPAGDIKSSPQTIQADDPTLLDAGEVNVTPPGDIRTEPDVIVEDPALIDAGEVNVDAPSFEVTEEDVIAGNDTDVGIPTTVNTTRSMAAQQLATSYANLNDWRVRLALAPGAYYLYAGDDPGILEPLQATDGVIFPYTPSINVTYAANYEGTSVTHSNYKIWQYQSSSVDNISISCDFTAQDTFEANYLLAVIHFFRSVTKMFYGQDQNPTLGSPPPLCYLYGLGSFQFNEHPLLITTFNYVLPSDVDYIKADIVSSQPGVNRSAADTPNAAQNMSIGRLQQNGNNIGPGGVPNPASFSRTPSGTNEPTWVPTKINLQISAVPVVARNVISQDFSLKAYGSGELLRGIVRKGRGGVW